MVDAAEVARNLDRDDDERDGADRDVDVEDPAPGELLDEDAAEQRPDDARHAEHRAEQPLVAAALAGRDDVADDRLRADHQPAAAETLDGPERDQLDHACWLSPESTEPARKMTIAAWKKTLRPYWSPSLPQSGVETVAASR